jgi:hypothetical protein
MGALDGSLWQAIQKTSVHRLCADKISGQAFDGLVAVILF